MEKKGNPAAETKTEKYVERTFAKYTGEDIARDAPGDIAFLNCNEAIARGAVEAGVRVATSYPGSPLQYALESLVNAAKTYPSMYAEWSANEKCCFDVCVGAVAAGVRAITVMKNEAFNLTLHSMAQVIQYGLKGFVIVVDDDPDSETTGSNQDYRAVAKAFLLPILEPSTMQEVKDFTALAFELSTELWMPVFVRVTERQGWGREPVVLGNIQHSVRERKAYGRKRDLWRNYGAVPARQRRAKTGQVQFFLGGVQRFFGEASEQVIAEVGQLPTLKKIEEVVERLPHHQLTIPEKARIGIITAGVAHLAVEEALDVLGARDELAVLKLAITHPLPKNLVSKLLVDLDTVLIVEEMWPLIEEQVRSLAAAMPKHAKILGKLTKDMPYVGEVHRNLVGLPLAKLLGKEFQPKASLERIELGRKILDELKLAADINISRQCPGCPEWRAIYALKTVLEDLGVDSINFGCDGCFVLTMNPPLEAYDVCLEMGGSISATHGFSKARPVGQKAINIMGDGSFFHGGHTGLLNAIYNKSNLLQVILDNRVIAMTGHQPTPGGFGITAMGESTKIIDIADIARAFQSDFVAVVDPYDLKQAKAVLEQAISVQGVSVVIMRRTCALVALRQKPSKERFLGPRTMVDQQRCLSWTVEMPPCQAACPAGVDAESYVEAIAAGDFDLALDIVAEAIPFPAVCGRVCHHPCEAACKRGKVDQPIAIRALKQFVAERGNWWAGRELQREEPTGKRVGIVGAGPAGLTAAYFLAKEGHSITVFEALPEAGGMMRYGIPQYRLPREVLDSDIEGIKSIGVEVRTNTKVNSVNELIKQGYDAVYLAMGSHRSLNMGITGEKGKGVMDSLAFLNEINAGRRVPVGEKVAVVGGGNSAIDAARAALRLGADVTILYRRTRAEMPAIGSEVDEALNEGVKIQYLVAPTRLASANGKVKVECVRMKLGELDATGRARPEPIPGSGFSLEVSTVISAVGQEPDLPAALQLATEAGKLKVDPHSLATNRPGVFAGGDAVTGPGTVIEAIAAGKRAAQSINSYLHGEPLPTAEGKKPETGENIVPRDERRRERVEVLSLPMDKRTSTFEPIELGFTDEMAMREAKRCLNCRTCNRCLDEFACIAIAPAENTALGKRSPVINWDLCVGCGVCMQVCPYGNIKVEATR